MRTVSRRVVCVFSVALVFPAAACTVTRHYPLEWNAAQVASDLEVLFPELLFTFDPIPRLLKATGCDKQFAPLEKCLAVAKTGDVARWQSQIEERLWKGTSQVGLFRHSVYGFELKKPSGNWKIASVWPDATWAARLSGKPLYGLTLTQNKARMIFIALDLAEVKTAAQAGETDSKLPLALWPQAMPDSKWVGAVSSEYQGRIGGHAKEKTAYRSRAVWDTGTEKIVCERFYVAQPSESGASTRLYFFMITMPQADFVSSGKSLEDFVGNFSMPETPMQAVLAKAPESLKAASEKAATSSKQNPASPARAYQWQLDKNPSSAVQEVLRYARDDRPNEAEPRWLKTLPSLSKAERPEALWYLASAQIQQRKYSEACSTLHQLQKEASDHPFGFQAAMTQGMVQGFYRQEWNQAQISWQYASKLAKDESQRWQVACKLATVPFYKQQYRPALEALEGLLKQYPTEKTADFVLWYLWYIKNCPEKKI